MNIKKLVNVKFENLKNIVWIDLLFNELIIVDFVRNVYFSGKIFGCVNIVLNESFF